MVEAISTKDMGVDVNAHRMIPIKPVADSRQLERIHASKSGGEKNIRNVRSTDRLDEKKANVYAEKLNQVMDALNQTIRFDLDKDVNRLVVKVVDRTTNKVIRQIPPEEMLKIKQKIGEMIGLILDEKV